MDGKNKDQRGEITCLRSHKSEPSDPLHSSSPPCIRVLQLLVVTFSSWGRRQQLQCWKGQNGFSFPAPPPRLETLDKSLPLSGNKVKYTARVLHLLSSQPLCDASGPEENHVSVGYSRRNFFPSCLHRLWPNCWFLSEEALSFCPNPEYLNSHFKEEPLFSVYADLLKCLLCPRHC